ncbi:hypothetical protein HC031_19655 [Planosporangium thailandense]|uniref:Uncharacterized protein n=1 Tax=Planosporangium thailandense TaxID=765197 RepID=A0ABX0Y3K5_9ACTN|nr:hypothetical protein [Planosporangium thailandense]
MAPSSGLADRQTVTVSASGFQPGHDVYVVECGQSGPACHSTEYRHASVDGDGRLQVSLPAYRTFAGVGGDGVARSVDCAAVQCSFVALDPVTNEHAEAVISFG